MPYILRIYPGAQFIHAIRDGREVANSFVRKGWSGRSYELALQRWASVTTTIRALGLEYAPKQYLELRHDALVAQPTEEVDRLFTFLGKTPAASAFGMVDADRASQFQSFHSREDTRMMEILAPDIAKEFLHDATPPLALSPRQ